MVCVFPNQELILGSIVLVILKEWLVLRNKLDYTHTNVDAKVQPHQPSVLIVFQTQMLKYLRFVKGCVVCGNNQESTSQQLNLVISMIKFVKKGDYYLPLLTVEHCFFFFYACGYYKWS